MHYTFFVPGKPQPKQRPRRGRGGHFYTPPETVRYQNYIRAFFLQTFPDFKIDKNHKWLLEIWIYGKFRGDGDNVLKSVADALEGFVYVNDFQVMQWICTLKPDQLFNDKKGVYIFAQQLEMR